MTERIDPREAFDQYVPSSEDWAEYEEWLDSVEDYRETSLLWNGVKLYQPFQAAWQNGVVSENEGVMSTNLGKIQCADKGCIFLTRYCGNLSQEDRRIQITYQFDGNWCYFSLDKKGALALSQKLTEIFNG